MAPIPHGSVFLQVGPCSADGTAVCYVYSSVDGRRQACWVHLTCAAATISCGMQRLLLLRIGSKLG